MKQHHSIISKRTNTNTNTKNKNKTDVPKEASPVRMASVDRVPFYVVVSTVVETILMRTGAKFVNARLLLISKRLI